MTRAQFLKSLRSLVVYHQSCGIDHYPDTEQIKSGLRALDEIADGEPASKSSPVGRKQDAVLNPPKPSERSDISLDELSREIARCRICALHEMRKISTPGRGGSSPQLLIVGDWLAHHRALRGNELFGDEQDQMLGNMMRAINLGPDDVFITNVIKCSVDRSYRADSDHLAACVNYLRQQIALLLPKIICTMGPVASQTLLASDESLIRLRGKLHHYALADGTRIPVMPTFHPTYLLKNPEMKKPTWNDLQAVRKQLDSVQ